MKLFKWLRISKVTLKELKNAKETWKVYKEEIDELEGYCKNHRALAVAIDERIKTLKRKQEEITI